MHAVPVHADTALGLRQWLACMQNPFQSAARTMVKLCLQDFRAAALGLHYLQCLLPTLKCPIVGGLLLMLKQFMSSKLGNFC